MPKVLLELRNITMNFQKPEGICRALTDVSLKVEQGSIHALVGENGAGKSTLMKVLYGLLQPTHGEIFKDGNKITLKSPQVAKQLGIGMVQQHFMLAGALPALDHLFLDDQLRVLDLKSQFAPLPRAAYQDRAEELAEKFGLAVPWTEKVENLSAGYQQRVELMKLLFHESQILILDEPTALLSPIEVDRLLKHLKNLRALGLTILIITHKLNEVFAIADDVSVLRKGTLVHSGRLKDQTSASLAALMVGTDWQAQTLGERTPAANPELLLKTSKLSIQPRPGQNKQTKSLLSDFEFTLKRNEIVGIAGVEGQGQGELMKLFLARFRGSDFAFESDGTIEFKTNLKLGFIGEDRLHDSVVPEMTLTENFYLSHQMSGFGRAIIDWKQCENSLAAILKDYDVQPPTPSATLNSLSGGNQQKFVVGRELSHQPDILLVSQPTRGVDFAASAHIHNALLKCRNAGAGVLLVSSDLQELFELSDRILIINEGRKVGEFKRGEFDATKVGALMGGAE